jgi:DNA polymerase-1
MRFAGQDFREVWCADFEYGAPPGAPPSPVCLVARELHSGCTVRLWEDELHRATGPPYPLATDSLFVAYNASAELGCHLVLGWPLPMRVLDLYTEFRAITNGRGGQSGKALPDAMGYFGLDAMSVRDKESMRALALRGGPWSREERRALLDYCESDVQALVGLVPRMTPHLDMTRALFAGRYMGAVARMEHRGVPLDGDRHRVLRGSWSAIQEQLVEEIDREYGVYDGLTFNYSRFEHLVSVRGIDWPRHETGRLKLDKDTFRDMCHTDPFFNSLRELRASLSQMRLEALAVGPDGRNRCSLRPFVAKTSRNQPSSSQFVFGPATWLRGLIRPTKGWGLAYVDWSQQEFGIAAALSGDLAMLTAYKSGDPYLAFARQAGAVPACATKKTHGIERDQFKGCALGVLYGMGARALARRIRQPEHRARHLLGLHRKTYPVFWQWSRSATDRAMLLGGLSTVFRWPLATPGDTRPGTLLNYPMQANAAEMLRLACCLATERGVRVCCPVHDALLIEAPLGKLNEEVVATQTAMAEASSVVLGGFVLRSEAKVVRYPERYLDKRGKHMWEVVARLTRGVKHDYSDCQPVRLRTGT